jgi:putative FmdB family regulatory protein
MPLYEYQCSACKERTEILQRVSDPAYTHCPKCGGEMKKLLSAPAIQFKGSGFYKTDYASTPTTKSESKGEKSETKSESTSTNEAKAEKKTSD